MLTSFERKIAFRYLRARREEGLISVIALFSLIGIALGVATLIVVLSVMNGVRDEMIKSVIGLEGHISVYGDSQGISNYNDVAKNIVNIPGVVSAIPKVEGQIMASVKGLATGAQVVAYRSQDLQYKKLLTDKIKQGEISNGESILIGSRMAEKMGLRLRDSLTLISPEGRATIAGLVPRVKAYPIGGIFTIGMFVYDNNLIVLPFEEAQLYFKLKDSGFGIQDSGRVSLIEVMVSDAHEAPQIAKKISTVLGQNLRVYDWKSSNNQLFHAVIVQRNVMFLILMLIIIVATFNIISSLIMLVREKTSDIAILRTIGASRASVMRIFILCGASVGIIGTLGGVCLGLLIAFNTENIQSWLESITGRKLLADELYFLSHLPSKVDSSEVLMVVFISLLLSFIATLYPARRAASLSPVEALRHE